MGVQGRAAVPGTLPDLQMKMRGAAGTGVAHQTDGLTGLNGVTDLHMGGAVPDMQIPGVVGLTADIVPNHDMAGPAGGPILSADHRAGGDRPERRALRGDQILTQVVGGGTRVRAAPGAIAGAEGEGPGQRLDELSGAAGVGDRHTLGQRRGRGQRGAALSRRCRRSGSRCSPSRSRSKRNCQPDGQPAHSCHGKFLVHRHSDIPH